MVKHTEKDLLAAALRVVRSRGLRGLSFGKVAREAGTNDRTVVYYFPTMQQLVNQVLQAMSSDLEARLLSIGLDRRRGPRDLLRAAWPVLANPEADEVFALFFEASGLAAAGVAPYSTIVPGLVTAWQQWAEARLQGTPATRYRDAEAAVALIDGLLLFRQIMGADAAGRAAQRLGDA